MPVIRFGDRDRWARRIVARLGNARHADFYRFLVRRTPEYTDGGQRVVDAIFAELHRSVFVGPANTNVSWLIVEVTSADAP